LSSLPKSFGNLVQLQELCLSRNKLSSLSESFGNLVQLQKLNLSDNNLSSLPESFGNLVQLQILCLNDTELSSLPESFGNFVHLQTLNLSNNNLSSLPSWLPRLINCREFYYDNNEIENIPINVERWLNRTKNVNNVYVDSQSVHNSNIQESFRKSVESLLNDKNTDLNLEEILMDKILNTKVKEQIVEYCNDGSIHSTLGVTFKELLGLVWERIKKNENKEEILKVLNEEIMDAECKCFTGRITRIVNVLNGYYDDIRIGISENEQIGTIISLMLKEGKEKEYIEKELISRGIEKEKIKEWMDYM
jgi:hypothetical protein